MASDVLDEDWRDHAVGGSYTGEVEIRVRENPDGTREAVIVPRGIKRLGEEGFFLMRQLQQTTIALRKLSEQLEGQVGEAREVGMSWDSIGFCVGTTGEAARQRWGDDTSGE